MPQAFCVVYVLIPSQPPKHRLPQHSNKSMPAIPAGAHVSEHIARHRRQTERIVEFPVREQSCVEGDHRSAKLEHQPAVEIKPENAIIRFTRRVRHDSLIQITITCCEKIFKNYALKSIDAEWLAARLELLEAEKELTRRSDELARWRQELPWVRIVKDYVFDTDEGEQTLRDLFAGRSQLLVYHFMFGPKWSAGCPTCTLHAESFDRAVIHLNQRDVTTVCASRGPLAQLNAYKQRMGLTFRWVSSLRSDFNYDFGVSLRADGDPDAVVFNFNTPWRRYNAEKHAGLSAFALEDGVVYHTYSCHMRGLEEFNVTYQLLDRVPRGRDEDKLPYLQAWIRRRDEYGAGSV